MCWSVPGKLIEFDGLDGVVEMSGIRRAVRLDLIDDPALDDYLLIHAGYALQKVDKERAEFTIDFFNQQQSQ